MSGVRAEAAVTGVWAAPLIGQFASGVLQVDNVAVAGVAGASGPGITYNVDVAGNMLGNYTAGSGWTVAHVAGQLGDYGVTLPMANFVDDTAAAAGGVPIGRRYRNGSIQMIRVA